MIILNQYKCRSMSQTYTTKMAVAIIMGWVYGKCFKYRWIKLCWQIPCWTGKLGLWLQWTSLRWAQLGWSEWCHNWRKRRGEHRRCDPRRSSPLWEQTASKKTPKIPPRTALSDNSKKAGCIMMTPLSSVRIDHLIWQTVHCIVIFLQTIPKV